MRVPLLELIVKETIGIALKSSKAATYIDQLLELGSEEQNLLQTIVSDCLNSIVDADEATEMKQHSAR